MKQDSKDIEDAALLAKIDIKNETQDFIKDIDLMITSTLSDGLLTADATAWTLQNKTQQEIYELCYGASQVTMLREDVVCPSMAVDEVLQNATSTEAGCISLPKVFGKEA